jgi:acyl-CoA synthetase (NDP forming)
MEVDKLRNLFEPKSIALIGQSGLISGIYDMTTAPLIYLLKSKYNGEIFPVNPKYDEICGCKCYQTLSEIPEAVDAVLFLVPASKVIPLLEECGRKKVRAAIITCAGFGETGERGRQEEERIREIAESYGMAVLGPNCNGLINIIHGIPLSFSPVLEGDELVPGPIGFVSQSGAILTGIGARGTKQRIGFTYLVSTGNEAHIDSVDIINYMVQDEYTKVIMALIEGVKDGRKFLEVANRALDKKKPIIILKLGQSEIGRSSALSHTGSLAGSARVNDAAFRQSGVQVVEEVNDFIESGRIFTQTILPNGDGIGVVSTSGGLAELAADLIQKRQLRIGSLSAKSLNDLSKMIRWFASAKNPFDFAGQLLRDETFPGRVFDIFLGDEDINLLLVIMTPLQRHEAIIFREAMASGKNFNKPVVMLYIGGNLGPESADIVSKSNIPFFESPNECVRAIESLIRYGTFINKRKSGQRLASDISDSAKRSAIQVLAGVKERMTEREAKLLLSQYEIPVAREQLAANVEEAIRISKSMRFPVALKIESPDIVHKSEVGGVRLNIGNEEALISSFEEMLLKVKEDQPNLEIRGILIQEMILEQGVEGIIGVFRDPEWGPVIMFGLGGVLVEVLEDISLRICPVTESDVWEMIREIKGYKLLRGFRGAPKSDLEAVVHVLVRLSQLAMDFQENITEIDINPLLILSEGKGVIAIDSSVVLC